MDARVAVMAGGTGGHVFPALAVAELLRAQGMEVFWIGTRRGMEARLAPQRGFPIEWLSIEGLRGKGMRQMLAAPFKLLVALRQAAGILRRRRPALALGMGGFASGPGGLMAKVLGVPLVIQEQNRGSSRDFRSHSPRSAAPSPVATRSGRRSPLCRSRVRGWRDGAVPAICWWWVAHWGRRS